MKYIGKNIANDPTFFNGKYYFSLNEYFINNTLLVDYPINRLGIDILDTSLCLEYSEKHISKDEMVKNITIVKERFLEVYL